MSEAGVGSLQCDWQAALPLVHEAYQESTPSLEAESSLLLISRRAQEKMSSAASDYDLSRLITGSALAGVAVILSLIASADWLWRFPGPVFFFIFTITSYGVVTFASSYVEEEQQFWYWILGGWVLYLHIKS